MSRPLVVSIFGTRPEAIKMAPLVLALQAQPGLEHRTIITAQHRELLDEVLELFGIQVDHDLNLMQERQSLEYVMSSALTGLCEILRLWRPAFALVHGDTTTTFAAALAAYYAGVRVGHVESGLRTASIARPYPEELNRRLADVISAQYYCPTEGAAENLRHSRDCGGAIYVTGNTALDAVRLMQRPGYEFGEPRLAAYAAHPGPRLLVTAHRRENWGAPLEGICRGLLGALDGLSAQGFDTRACFCWHPNPAVREVVGPLLGHDPRVLLTDPPRFDVFVNLLAQSDLILSDSGGIQEEVTQLRRFVLVLREETERPEAVDSGFARLVGTEAGRISAAVLDSLPLCLAPERGGLPAGDPLRLPASNPSPFGDGHAAAKIVAALKSAL
jgi:UDP-N-acetylglucosamine 2-epimerase (non-hydrolysing)